jgi:rhodanese-related sulfurtransferase
MHHGPGTSFPSREPLVILCANVRRSDTAHRLLLQAAFDTKANLVLIQEPYINRDYTRKLTA